MTTVGFKVAAVQGEGSGVQHGPLSRHPGLNGTYLIFRQTPTYQVATASQ